MMNRFVKAALSCAFLATPGAAFADYCEGAANQTHTILTLYNGYFPNTLYACPGDTIEFENDTSKSVRFEVSSGSYSQSIGWISGGRSTTYTIPTGYDSLRLNKSTLSGARNRSPLYGYIVFGQAPDS